MSVCLYDLDWQKFPVKLQKYLIIMMGNMQTIMVYHGFGVVCLDLMTFIAVRYRLQLIIRLTNIDEHN